MNKPREDRESVRSDTFTVSATRAEKEAIMKMASNSGLTMSAWVRMVIRKEIDKK